MSRRPSLALVLDPRFGGGTSSAVAREIVALAPVFDLQVAFIGSRMFGTGRSVHPGIAKALEDTGLGASWDPPRVSAETVVFHNPSFLKFDEALSPRFNCARAIAVAHENFLRSDGTEGFDVGKTLGLIAARLPPCPKLIAPVSPITGERLPPGLTIPGQAIALGTLHRWTGSISAILPAFPRPPPQGTGAAVSPAPGSRSFRTWPR